MAKKRGHGEGSISQRKDGRWMGQVTLGIDQTTKKAKRLTYYGKTRKEVLLYILKKLFNLVSC